MKLLRGLWDWFRNEFEVDKDFLICRAKRDEVWSTSVYKSTYDLLLLSFWVVKHFPREYKFSLGEKIKQEILELTCLLFRSNNSQEKKSLLTLARERIETVRLLRRVSKDMKIVDLKKYVEFKSILNLSLKQLTAWQKIN